MGDSMEHMGKIIPLCFMEKYGKGNETARLKVLLSYGMMGGSIMGENVKSHDI